MCACIHIYIYIYKQITHKDLEEMVHLNIDTDKIYLLEEQLGSPSFRKLNVVSLGEINTFNNTEP